MMTTFEIHVKILQLINSSQKNIWIFQINNNNNKKKKKIDSHAGAKTFDILDRIPLRKFVSPTTR